MFGIQSLWSAARYQAGALFVVLSNGGYAIMDRLAEMQNQAAPWPSFGSIDIAAIARAQGCPAVRVETNDALLAALDDVVPTLASRQRADADRSRGRAERRLQRVARFGCSVAVELIELGDVDKVSGTPGSDLHRAQFGKRAEERRLAGPRPRPRRVWSLNDTRPAAIRSGANRVSFIRSALGLRNHERRPARLDRRSTRGVVTVEIMPAVRDGHIPPLTRGVRLIVERPRSPPRLVTATVVCGSPPRPTA